MESCMALKLEWRLVNTVSKGPEVYRIHVLQSIGLVFNHSMIETHRNTMNLNGSNYMNLVS